MQKYPDMSMQILLNTTMHPFINISRSGANFSVPSEAVFYVKTKNGTVPVFTINIVRQGYNVVCLHAISQSTFLKYSSYCMYNIIL